MPLLPARLKSDFGPSVSWWIFLTGLALFIAFQTGLVLEVQLSRTLPPEAKDAYRYIFNALQLREGFIYNTPAMEDFRTLTEPEPGDSVRQENQKWIVYHSLFFTHYIFHSVILLAISGVLGVSLGTAYKITCVLGSLFIAGAVSYFLLTITDRISTGLALGSLALTMFPMQGIHYVVPTNLCMAVGLIMVAFLMRTDGKAKWSLFFFSIICIYLHRMGVIYAGIGVLTLLILQYKREGKKQIFIDLLPTLLVIGVSTLIIFVFPLPFFRMSPMTTPPETNYIKEIWLNLVHLFKLIGNWFISHGVVILPKPLNKLLMNNWLSFLGFQIFGLSLCISANLLKRKQDGKYHIISWIILLTGIMFLLPLLSAVVLIVILQAGWLYPQEEKKFHFYLAFILFFLILIPSTFHVMYIAEWKHSMARADLTNRLWIPFALVLAAGFGRGLYWVFHKVREGSYDFLPKFSQIQERVRLTLKPRSLKAIFVLFLVLAYMPRLAQAYMHRQNIKTNMLVRQSVVFDPDQVRRVYKNSAPQDIIVYDDDFIRHYFLTHGGLWRRALYLPLFPVPEDYKFSPEDIKYEISWNPYLSVYRNDYERAIQYPLPIPGNSEYTLTLDPAFQPREIRILPGSDVESRSSTKLQIIRKSASGDIRKKDIQIQGKNWQKFPLIPQQGGTLSLVNLEPSQAFYLAGLNLNGQKDHNFLWPWQGVTKVTLDDNQHNLERSAILVDEITIKGVSYDRAVIQDKGSTVLWRLKPKHE